MAPTVSEHHDLRIHVVVVVLETTTAPRQPDLQVLIVSYIHMHVGAMVLPNTRHTDIRLYYVRERALRSLPAHRRQLWSARSKRAQQRSGPLTRSMPPRSVPVRAQPLTARGDRPPPPGRAPPLCTSCAAVSCAAREFRCDTKDSHVRADHVIGSRRFNQVTT